MTISGATIPAYGINDNAIRWRKTEAVRARAGGGPPPTASGNSGPASLRACGLATAGLRRKRTNIQAETSNRPAEAAAASGPVAFSSCAWITDPRQAYQLRLVRDAGEANRVYTATIG